MKRRFLLCALIFAGRENALTDEAAAYCWRMVRRTATCVVMHCTATEQDRLEENNSRAPFSVMVAVASFLC